MRSILRTLLKRWLEPSLPVVAAPSSSHGGAGEVAILVPYDENLLERALTQWQFGDWESLARLEWETLQHHPDRARLALLAAAGRLQNGEDNEARQYVRLAQDWGASQTLIARVLVAGVHNSLGRAAAVTGEQLRALWHFESAIGVGLPERDRYLLAQARSRSQFNQIRVGLVETKGSTFRPGIPLDDARQALFLHEGFEAATYRVGDQVVKIYKPSYFQYNKDYNRSGEGHFLKNYSSKYFIPLLHEDPFCIITPYLGERIGNAYELNHDQFNSEKLCSWLRGLQIELGKLGIKHRDINPSNIIYNKNSDDFILIDFGWAIGPEDADKESKKPQGMNPYGPSDDEAIEKLITSTIQHLNTTARSRCMNRETVQKHAYTRAVGSQSEIPTISIQEDGSWRIDGYQCYRVNQYTILEAKAEHEKKFAVILPFMAQLIDYRFIDIGCSSGYFGIQALLHGASHVSFLDHDPEYLAIASQVLLHLGLGTSECVCSTVSEYSEVHDVGFVFALVHWIYSYSDTFGSLQAIVDHLYGLASHTLFIEWIDPADYAMGLAQHIQQNPERIRDDYTKANFIEALRQHYLTVALLAEITPTRHIYIATKMHFNTLC